MSLPPPPVMISPAPMRSSSLPISCNMVRGGGVVFCFAPDNRGGAPAAPPAVLLIHPKGHADGAARLEAELLHERDGLQAGNDGCAIVLRALPDVPGIDVAAHHDYLFGMLAAGDLADHVAAIGVGEGLRAHL